MKRIISILLLLVFSLNAFAGGTQYFKADNYDINGLGTLSDDEWYYLKGVTSNLQTQLNGKVSKTGAETIAGEKVFTDRFFADSTTAGFHPCPSMTDTDMLAIVGPQDGDCVHNTTLDSWLVYKASESSWEEVGGGGGISNWLTAENYDIGDVVIQSSKIYQALTAHTSGTFATDLSGGKWTQIANNVSDASGILPLANGGSNKNMTAVAGGVVWTDADSQEVSAAGTSGQVLKSNGTSAPSFGAVDISTASVTGVLPMANGGSAKALTPVAGAVIVSDSDSMEVSAAGTSGQFLKSNGTSAPSFSSVDLSTSSVTGVLPLANGGSAKSLTAAAGGVVYTDADSMEVTASGVSGRVLTANGTGAPTWNISKISLEDTSGASSAEAIIVPNNTKTELASNGFRIETGNSNLLSNPSFERLTGGLTPAFGGWSTTFGTTTARDTTNVTDGNARIKVSHTSQVVDINQCSTLYASTFANGTFQGMIRADIQHNITSTPLYLCPCNSGAAPSSSQIPTVCLPLSSGTIPYPYELPFNLGGTSNGLWITSNGVAVTGDVYIDNAEVKKDKFVRSITPIGQWTTWTPTGTWTTNTTYTGRYRQVGQNLEMEVNVATSAAPTSATLNIDLPSGYTVDLSKLSNTSPAVAAHAFESSGVVVDSGSRVATITAFYASTTAFNPVAETSTSGTAISQTAPMTWGTGDYLNVIVSVPVTQFSAVSSIYDAPSNGNEISQVIFTSQTSAPTDFISAMNKSIGKSSGDYQGNDYYRLYSILWAQAGLSTTAGDVYVISSAKGASAQADWDAGKLITVDYQTNSPFIRAAGTGISLGAYSDSDNKSHNHSMRYNNSAGGGGPWQGTGFGTGNGTLETTTMGLSGGTEAKPKNVALNAWIRYRPASLYVSIKDVVTSQGSTTADIQSVYFGSSADCSTACTTGNCTICNQVGTKITSVSWASAAGQYNINGIDGTKYNCTGQGIVPSVSQSVAVHLRASSTSTYARINTYNSTASTANSAYNSVTCTGIP